MAAVLAVTTALALGAIGCGDDEDENGGGGGGGGATQASGAQVKAPEGIKALDKLGKGEGRVDLIAWAGYVESGQTDPKVDWVSGFEKETGCKVNVKTGNTSDEMVTLMRTGNYDGVSASGDATLRLIAGGDVAPVNTDLIPNYADVYDALKDKPHNSVDGQMYGVPHGRGANLLMWNKAKVKPAPDSWGVVFDESSPHKGKVTAYDNPIYIADAALYLKATQPELGIENVYELDDKQFSAAIDLLKKQRQVIGEYWSDYTKEQAAFNNGDTVVGTTWQVIANLIEADGKVKVGTTLPKEGSTGWSDTWMIHSKAKHPNCMYMWMNHIISPQANAEVAEWFGEAPSNQKSCALTANKDHCEIFHAEDEAYFEKVAFWTTPTKNCGDERGNVCKDYNEWVQAWTEVKG
ncbi:MAG TPA: ABC transporter substrate-binding protein [Solirubrobacteraceae bacterium]|jgi:putative spermidine/putrescine transport system substrate-binding protein|nr:ABC transporter substrate-binding protein [Solirubrobacteraceae bacterium]